MDANWNLRNDSFEIFDEEDISDNDDDLLDDEEVFLGDVDTKGMSQSEGNL